MEILPMRSRGGPLVFDKRNIAPLKSSKGYSQNCTTGHLRMIPQLRSDSDVLEGEPIDVNGHNSRLPVFTAHFLNGKIPVDP